MTIKFTAEEAAEIVRQYVIEKLVKFPKTDIRACIHCPAVPGIEISIEVWDGEVDGE